MANVRFYRLETLPSFDSSKHVGVFVHLTTANDTYKAGLWFGGTTGWEYLTNDTNAIDAAIDAKINVLDVTGYAQATISTNTPAGGEDNSTLTISGIKEDNGKIAKDDSNKLEVAIDGGYDKTNNKIATQKTVENAIKGLKVEDSIQAVTKETSGVNTVLTFKGIKEADGVILQGTGNEKLTVGNANLKIQIGSDTAYDVFSANAQVDSTIKLDGLVFKKNGDVISVITPTALASDNRLVTEKDVANLAGAMHYKGPINDPSAWPTTVKAGDVYISNVNRNFIYNGQQPSIEPGDMIVFNSESVSDFTVIQSNLTLGTGDGQVAANVGNLAKDEIVIASENGIKTSGFKLDTASSRVIGVSDLAESEAVHGTKVSDTLTVFGQNRNASLTINSNNKSIEITGSNTDNDATITVDLVWNTIME